MAANFAGPMKTIAQAFERHTGHRAVLSVGSTGALHAQVLNGAPFDVFLSADDSTPARLETQGRAISGTRFVYATGRLVLWSPQPDLVDAQGRVLSTLTMPGNRRLAIANPRLAPYGAAALDTLERLGLATRLQPHLIQGENIAQVHQFVATGNADLGFVALSQVMREGRMVGGSSWIVPASMHLPLRQEAVLLSRAGDSSAARALLAFLRGPEARRIMAAQGYEFSSEVLP